MTTPNDSNPVAPAAEISIPIGDLKWTQVLPMLIAAIEDGTPAGARMAKDYLTQMAAVADVAGVAIGAVMRADSQGLDFGDEVMSVINQAKHGNPGRGH